MWKLMLMASESANKHEVSVAGAGRTCIKVSRQRLSSFLPSTHLLLFRFRVWSRYPGLLAAYDLANSSPPHSPYPL